MDASEDLDIKLQKVFSQAITDAKVRLGRFVGNDSKRSNPKLSFPRLRDFDHIVKQINMLQEEPQLLDSHLQDIMPLLTDTFISAALFTASASQASLYLTLSSATSVILYTLCKVRGEKVISRFFDNDPKYIEPLLYTLRIPSADLNIELKNSATSMSAQNPTGQVPLPTKWEDRYIAMLWLAHLMLTPFDLASVSTMTETEKLPSFLSLPSGLPILCQQLISISFKAMVSPSKERDAAAKLVVSMCLRPDMKAYALLEHLMTCTLSILSSSPDLIVDTYQYMGFLTFINDLISRADRNTIMPFFPEVYDKIRSIFDETTAGFSIIRSSAVARKLWIKIQRNIIVKLLQPHRIDTLNTATASSKMLDDLGASEAVIDFLLHSTADRDTTVRYAVAKALSIISLSLESEMAAEVVEAVLAGFNEDVADIKENPDVTAVNPLRWHALTLTLGHFLFRRTPTPDQLPRVLYVLSLALMFEQRSIAGNPIGSNVRDAANFGIWSLARRYSTAELLALDPSSVQATSFSVTPKSTIQWIANVLATAACLDPVGNIRRGSSAALQELVGRHPDTVTNGIMLIQIIDYSAVALRRKAITTVCLNAAKLSEEYWDVIMEGLFGWRGVLSPDRVSRNFAAQAVGLLSGLKPFSTATRLVEKLRTLIASSQFQNVEARHGFSMSLASIISNLYPMGLTSISATENDFLEPILENDLYQMCSLWDIFGTSLRLSSNDFSSASLRPELSAEIVIHLCSAISRCCLQLRKLSPEAQLASDKNSLFPTDKTIARFNISLGSTDASVLEALPEACSRLCRLLPTSRSIKLVETLIQDLKVLKDAPRTQGIMVALASIWITWENALEPAMEDLREAILEELLLRSSSPTVEIRIIATRALGTVLIAVLSGQTKDTVKRRIYAALHYALQDYEITARGDVGSLVRMEALEVIWRLGPFGLPEEIEEAKGCLLSVHRLALERIDKTRLQAARCLTLYRIIPDKSFKTLADVSTFDYFFDLASLLNRASKESTEASADVTIQLLEGFSSSVGAGADLTLQVARSALVCVLDTLPTEAEEDQSLTSIGRALIKLTSMNITNDRVLVPLLQMLSFFCDVGVFKRLEKVQFKWRTLLFFVQKTHYKSTNLAKVRAAVEVYRGLGEVEIIRQDVVNKVVETLSHPLLRVRLAAAETLFQITKDESLKPVDWSKSPTDLKWTIQDIKRRHVQLN